MLYTGDFVLRYYVRFSQIRSHMSIRKYFKPVQKDVSLPNPHGPLSSKVPPGAIEAANDKVSETIKPSGSDCWIRQSFFANNPGNAVSPKFFTAKVSVYTVAIDLKRCYLNLADYR